MLKLKASSTWCFLLVMALSLALFASCSQSEKTEQKVEPDTEPTAKVEAFEYTPVALASLDNYNIECGGGTMDLAGPVAEIASAIGDSSFLYSVKPLTDCSGIFHRVLNGMKERCPEYAYPPIEQYRDTRDLARWYHEQGKLILIQDMFAHANLIKPGAVLFYGQRDSVYKDFTSEDLFKRGSGINHMGVVVKVHMDDANKVASYELFHGHGRPGKTPASTTNYHRREPTRATYPPYGNGTEQWVAFATLVSPTDKMLTKK